MLRSAMTKNLLIPAVAEAAGDGLTKKQVKLAAKPASKAVRARPIKAIKSAVA